MSISPDVIVSVVLTVRLKGTDKTFPAPTATVKLAGPLVAGNSVALAVVFPVDAS